MFVEDLAPFFDAEQGFGTAARLNGQGVAGQFDTEGALLFDGEVASTSPSFLLPASSAPDAVGLELVIDAGPNAGTYLVRNATPEPPDGALVRLHLARSA